MKLNRIFLALFATIILIACNNDDDGFNHAAQAITDDEDIVSYLKSHYLDMTDDEIKEIDADQTPLFDNMVQQKVLKNNIEYSLYYYVEKEGVTINPTPVDSVLTSYKGTLLDGKTFETAKNPLWFTLNGVITGWTYGIPHFKGGILQTNDDGTFEYLDKGKGIIVMPSGLAYGNASQPNSIIEANSPLVFQLELHDVNETDSDNDGILSKFEDVNKDGIYDDDSDNDTFLDYLDGDDDNDGVLTKYENVDPNEDGDPSDAVDTDGDGTPDYLDTDDDGDGTPTADEDADEDKNGNPDDAKDSDNDGTPDYLDAN
ncbi:FKBP-type peptidyl-prolyl cis-trans isomerase [Aureivirga sp. CE67]|uniref:FKBP-type peptidyl-prolyl cis-trans isomerase n=1 Tax=Aureivirga sp. CE67 TaxID=1788983 RepID=UPI0018C9EDF8|nr:FKBP-type peptidyl-prolyl cis-trans isomerase [Aureivirga sp. CE67]